MLEMKSTFIQIILFLSFTVSGFCQTPGKDSNNEKYRCTEIISYEKTGNTTDLIYILISLPPSNDYQETSNFDPHGGLIFDAPNSNEKYVRYSITNPEKGTVKLSYDYTPKNTEYLKSSVGKIYPYDTTSILFKTYTAKYYEMFDTDNDEFKNISSEIWKKSSDVYDFAKRCFNYVESNFAFKNNPGVWQTGAEIIQYGGGDCGNLATAFINLLRCQQIPARHVITKGHAWAEFYLENIGWIPVDPTFHLFGEAKSSYGIIRANEVYHLVDVGENELFLDYEMAKTHMFYPSHNGYNCEEKIELDKN